jgi:hypothetical protein
MSNTTIAELSELSKGSPVNQITAEVKKAFEYNEAEGQHGPYRYQAVILQDDTGEIRATFWNHWNTDFRNLEGEQLVLTSGRDKKDRFSGMTTDDYKGTRQLKVNENTAVKTSEGDLEAGSAPAGEHATAPTRKAEKQVADSNFSDREARKRVSIEKQSALDAAVRFHNSRPEGDGEAVLETAKSFYAWLHSDS